MNLSILFVVYLSDIHVIMTCFALYTYVNLFCIEMDYEHNLHVLVSMVHKFFCALSQANLCIPTYTENSISSAHVIRY